MFYSKIYMFLSQNIAFLCIRQSNDGLTARPETGQIKINITKKQTW